jgi:hypothetical protein
MPVVLAAAISRGSYLKNGWSNSLGVKTKVGQIYNPFRLADIESPQRFMLIK